jgi:predicted transcriptional regulator
MLSMEIRMSIDGLAPDVRQSLAHELALGTYEDEQDVLRHALAALAEYREAVAGVERGLADFEAGRFVTLEEHEKELRSDPKPFASDQ